MARNRQITKENRRQDKRIEAVQRQYRDTKLRAKYGPKRKPAPVKIINLQTGELKRVVNAGKLMKPTQTARTF